MRSIGRLFFTVADDSQLGAAHTQALQVAGHSLGTTLTQRIFVAPVGTAAETTKEPSDLPVKQADFVRFLLANHNGYWPDKPWKVLQTEYSEWTSVQNGARTTISRSTLSKLKQRFPKGFPLSKRPMDNFGRPLDTIERK